MRALNRWGRHGATALGVALLVLVGASAADAAQSPQLPEPLRSVVSGDNAQRPAPASSSSTPDWVSTINYWRQAAGLTAVSDQPAWDLGIQHHLTYLENTPASFRTGQYASAHTENPSSPYYTSDGATEGGDSDLVLGGANSDLDAINDWLTAPFHAIGMLRAQLTQVAFAEDSAGYAGLDVLQGLDYNQPAATSPILFPGPGSTTTLLSANTGEAPDPLETCGWQGMRVGLPLIALLPQAPATALTASLSGPTGPESTSNGSLCLVDEDTYHSSDPVYGPTGASILQNDKAVLLIPQAPLAAGTYSVDIQQPAQPDITWSFTVDVSVPTNVWPPLIEGRLVVGSTLTADHGQWTNFPTTYADQWLRCSASGADCNPIPGATSSTYVPPQADTGATIRVQEIASNSGGPSLPAVSAAEPIYDPSAPFGPGPSPVPFGPSPASTSSGSPGTNNGSKPALCSLCVSAGRPVALVIPSKVLSHHAFTVSLAGLRPFTVNLTISTRGGHRLWRSTRHLQAGRRTIRIRLPSADTGRGKTVVITARFTLGTRRITFRRTIQFR
jgi:hypothetical protein